MSSRVALCALLGALATCAEDRTPTSLPTRVALSQATEPIAGDVLVGAGNIARCDRQDDEATA